MRKNGKSMRKIYIIGSSSYHALNDKLASIIGDNTNITNFSLSEVNITDIIEDASYFGLFNDERIIVIKDCKYFSGKFNYEEDMEALVNYVSNMDEITTLIFICESIDKKKNNTKRLIELGAEVIDLTNIDEEQINRIIEEHDEKIGVVVDKDALTMIKENSLNNLDIIILEIEKLSNISNHITKQIVETSSIKLPTIDEFAFSNAVVAKKFTEAFNELDKLLSNGIDPYSIVGILASSYTNMYMVRDAVNRGLSDEEIAKKFGYASTGRVYVMKKNSKIYTTDELKEIIINLSKLDIKIKTGTKPIYAIKEFLLEL